MNKQLIAVLVVSALALICSAREEEIRGIDGILEPEEVAKFESLAPKLKKLNAILKEKLEKLPESESLPVGAIRVAKAELSAACMGSGSCLALDRPFRKVLKSFVALEKTADKCDSESFRILAQNKIAFETAYRMAHRGYDYFDTQIIEQTLKHFVDSHAKHCRPVHKQTFAHLIESVPAEVTQKLANIFSPLDIYDFGAPYATNDFRDSMNRYDLVGTDKIEFNSFDQRRALTKVARKLKMELGIDRDAKANLSELRPIIEKNLLEPCRTFRDTMSAALDEARFDAGVADETQEDYLHGDDQFHQALITNRLCGSLLGQGESLFELMTESWNNCWIFMKQ